MRPDSSTSLGDTPPKRRLQPEVVFVVLAAIFGLATLLANAPFQAPDENDHYFRTLQLSQGTIIGEKWGNNSGGRIPQVALKDMGAIPFHRENKMSRALFQRTLHPIFVDWNRAPRVLYGFPHTVIYPPTGYAPQVLAVTLGKLGHIGPLGLLYLARLAGFVVCVALGYAALRNLPVCRWTCLVLLLCPMSLYLMGSVAPDGMLITSAFLLLALLLQTDAGVPPTPRRQAAVLFLAGFLTVAKVVYFPLAALVPLLVGPRLAGRREKIVFAVAFAVVCLLPLWFWSRAMTGVYAVGRTDIPIDPAAQMRFVAAHPLNFLSLVATSARAEADFIYHWFVGTLGWGDTPMPPWYYSVFGWSLFVCLLADTSSSIRLKLRSRTLLLGAALAAALLVFGAQYAIWNAPGSQKIIDGMSGRYFLPIAPFGLAALAPPWHFKKGAPAVALFGTAVATLGGAVCVVMVILRYYFN